MRSRLPSGLAGKGVNLQVLPILCALLAGLLIPPLAGLYLAGRDSLPRSCRTGVLTSTQTDGAMTWASGPVLWFADGDRNRGRRLVDYTPARTPASSTPGPGAPGSPPPSPSASQSVAISPGVSPTPAAGPSRAPRFEAAAISIDRRLVAFMVSDPPGAPGTVSLRLISLLDPPGTAAVEAWSGSWLGGTRSPVQVVLLADGHIVFWIPHRFDPPETSSRVVAVAEGGSQPHVVESAAEKAFVEGLHSTWPETKSFRLPPSDPRLDGRVIAPNGAAAGILSKDVRTPLLQRTLYEVAAGRTGRSETRVICSSSEPLSAAALSPDGLTLAVLVGGNTEVLDLGGGRSLAFLVRGRMLDWHA